MANGDPVIVAGGGIGGLAAALALAQRRNDLWRGRTPERYYDALEWLYGWTAERCLAD